MSTSVPTRELLPNYMKAERWTDLADAIDSVFGQNIALQAKALEHIRHQYILNEEVEAKIESGLMVDASDYDKVDRQTAALQTATLGLNLTDSSYVDQDGFVNLTRNLGSHWFSKGLSDFVDFIAFTVNAEISLVNTWTQDYVTFVPEDLPQAIGTPVYESGSWYPTTHVRIRYKPQSFTLGDASLLAKLFYDLSNYNLVLQALEELLDLYMAEQGALPDTEGVASARIVALTHVDVEEIYIDTAI